jgi:hypothetical protein
MPSSKQCQIDSIFIHASHQFKLVIEKRIGNQTTRIQCDIPQFVQGLTIVRLDGRNLDCPLDPPIDNCPETRNSCDDLDESFQVHIDQDRRMMVVDRCRSCWCLICSCRLLLVDCVDNVDGVNNYEKNSVRKISSCERSPAAKDQAEPSTHLCRC